MRFVMCLALALSLVAAFSGPAQADNPLVGDCIVDLVKIHVKSPFPAGKPFRFVVVYRTHTQPPPEKRQTEPCSYILYVTVTTLNPDGSVTSDTKKYNLASVKGAGDNGSVVVTDFEAASKDAGAGGSIEIDASVKPADNANAGLTENVSVPVQ